MAATVAYQQEGSVALITLDGPPTNAYDLDTLVALDAAIVRARFDDDVHVIVLTGRGERFFSVGADTEMLSKASPTFVCNFCLNTHELLHRFEHTPKTIIAGLNGHAIGGGLEIALACDLRIARAGKLNLGFPEINVGVLPGSGGTQRLPRLIGKSRAFELIVEGQVIPVERAQAVGLVDKVWTTETDDAFRAKLLEYAQGLAPPNKASRAAGAIKRAIQTGVDASLDDGLALELELLRHAFGSEDAKTGFAAFAAKGKPSFKGR